MGVGFNVATDQGGNLDPNQLALIANNTLMVPNSLRGRHLRWAVQKNVLDPLASLNQSNTTTIGGVINGSGLCLYPTSPSFQNNVVWFDAHDLSGTFANGQSVSSFTDKATNVFTWVGATPPVFSTISLSGCPQSANVLNFASANGYYSSLIVLSGFLNPSSLQHTHHHSVYQLKSTSSTQVLFDFSTFNVNTDNFGTNIGFGFAPVLSTINIQASISGINSGRAVNIVSGNNPCYGMICRVDTSVNSSGVAYYSGLSQYNSDGRYGVPYHYYYPISASYNCYMPGSAIIDSSTVNYHFGYIASYDPSTNNPGYTTTIMNPLHTCLLNGSPIAQGSIGRTYTFTGNHFGIVVARGICFIGRGSSKSSSEQFKGTLSELLVVDQYWGTPSGAWDVFGKVWPYFASKYHPTSVYPTNNPYVTSGCSSCTWLYNN